MRTRSRQFEMFNPVLPVLLAHEYQTWVWLTIGRYRRNCRSISSTRDMGLLLEMIQELGTLMKISRVERTEAEPIPNIRGDIQESLDLYTKKAIARLANRSLEEQASLWAEIANPTRTLPVHFPAILECRDIRLRANNSPGYRCGERMQSFKDNGFANEHNERNIEIVHSRKTFYIGELTQIRESRETTTFDGLVTSLGEAANKVFDEYRTHFSGQDRRTRDVSLLNGYCEGLYHIARQMNELDNVREHDINQQNLATVLDHLRLYDREFQAIQEAQQRLEDGALGRSSTRESTGSLVSGECPRRAS